MGWRWIHSNIFSFVLFSFIIGIDGFFPLQNFKGTFKAPAYSKCGCAGDRPLLLTPLINAGQIREARELGIVRGLAHTKSYSGFITVNPSYGSNLFFWFFPAAINPETAPVLLFLQGGPGFPSVFSIFVENGPFIIDKEARLHHRNTSWTQTHSVLYIDNPVGTGFSFTGNEAGYARNEVDVARDLYNFLIQFFTMFPDYLERDFYVTGESYAGKYVPALSYKIHIENRNSPRLHINLKGLSMGSPFFDPISVMHHGDYCFNIGLLDSEEKEYVDVEEAKVRELIRAKEWLNAYLVANTLLSGGLSPGDSFFTNATGLLFYFNYLIAAVPADYTYYLPFLEDARVRRSIHVGSQAYDTDERVAAYLLEDIYQSVKPWLEVLLDASEAYRFLIYSGQLDIIIPNTGVDRSLWNLEWSGAAEFREAQKGIWRSDGGLGEVAGYVRRAKKLTYVTLRKAGHMAPYDQPEWTFDMISRFTAGLAFP